MTDIQGARCLAVLGDSVTTDHISPAGNIKAASPAGEYLIAHGVAPAAYGSALVGEVTNGCGSRRAALHRRHAFRGEARFHLQHRRGARPRLFRGESGEAVQLDHHRAVGFARRGEIG